jgi:hypothetical protein
MQRNPSILVSLLRFAVPVPGLDRLRLTGEGNRMQDVIRASERMREGRMRPLAGAKAWLISDGKAGHEAQCLGVAEALGVAYEWKRVSPSGLWRALSPWGPVSPRDRFGEPGTPFAPPWPDIAIAIGRTTTPYIRALKRKAGLKTYTVILLNPGTGAATADLFWVPEHDRRRGANVMTTLASPHIYSAERLAAIRREPNAAIDALPAPRVAVLVGGPNDRYSYPEPVVRRLVDTVRSLAGLGVGIMMTVSRRTPKSLADALAEAAQGTRAIFWRGEGTNPYPAFLSHADAFLVTADSVNMAGEAAATGRPIHVFEPAGGARKFTQFHERLRMLGITRPAPERFTEIGQWSYPPLSSAAVIAEEIARRYQRRLALLPGLV